MRGLEDWRGHMAPGSGTFQVIALFIREASRSSFVAFLSLLVVKL